MANDRHAENLKRYGAKLLGFLQERSTLDVVINPDGRVWVNRLGAGWASCGEMSPSTIRLLLAGVATVREIEFNHEHPILETIFQPTGDRITGLIPPVVEAPVLALRTRPKKIFSLAEMKASGILTDKSDPLNGCRNRDHFLDEARGMDHHMDILSLAGRYRKNILLVGPTGSGKTTIANGIVQSWAELSPDDRVIIIEDTPELQCSLPNHVQLLATTHVSQAELLVTSLRLIPRRLIVGEVREEAPARVLLTAWNTGHSGGLATIHANDALNGLRRLEVLVGGEHTRERIANAIDLVVFIDGEDSLAVGRKVRELMVIRSYDPVTKDYAVEHV